jgi:hypothetical protein
MCDEKAQLLAAYAAAVSALSKAGNNGIEEGFAIARTNGTIFTRRQKS